MTFNCRHDFLRVVRESFKMGGRGVYHTSVCMHMRKTVSKSIPCSFCSSVGPRIVPRFSMLILPLHLYTITPALLFFLSLSIILIQCSACLIVNCCGCERRLVRGLSMYCSADLTAAILESSRMPV